MNYIFNIFYKIFGHNDISKNVAFAGGILICSLILMHSYVIGIYQNLDTKSTFHVFFLTNLLIFLIIIWSSQIKEFLVLHSKNKELDETLFLYQK